MGPMIFMGVGGSGSGGTDVSVLLAQIGNIADLTTDDKSNLVAAINELNLDIGAMANGLKYQGTIGVDGTISALPPTHQTGWMYKVVTADTYAGQACEVGDMIICVQDGTVANDTDWSVVQGNTDRVVSNAGTSTTDHVAVFADSSGLEVKDGGYTIAANVPSNAKFTDTTYTFESADGSDGGVDIGISDGETSQSVKMVGKNGINIYTDTTADKINVYNTGITAIADLPEQDGADPAVFYTGAITATSVNGWDNSVSPQIITVQFPAILLATNGGTFTLSIDGDDALPICYAAGMNLSSYFYSVMTAYGVNPVSQYGATGYPITGSGMCLDLLFDGEQFSITSTQSSGLTNYAQIAAFDSKNQLLTSYVRTLSVDGDTMTVTKGDTTQSQITLPTVSIGDLSSLETTDKTSLVGAINEITVPITNNLSLTGTQSVTLTNGSENRIGEVSSLTLTLPSPIPDDYISILSFTSGATATALDYGESIKWVNGSTDVIDGIFVPIPNTRYTIVIRYDGQYVCGEVGGVAIEQTTD